MENSQQRVKMKMMTELKVYLNAIEVSILLVRRHKPFSRLQSNKTLSTIFLPDNIICFRQPSERNQLVTAIISAGKRRKEERRTDTRRRQQQSAEKQSAEPFEFPQMDTDGHRFSQTADHFKTIIDVHQHL